MPRSFPSRLLALSCPHKRSNNLELDAITIREATAHHIFYMMNLERRCGTAAHWSEKQYQNLFHQEGGSTARIALIARRDGPEPELLGFLIARNVAPEWELENIVVAPEVRGKGIGTRLIEELQTRAKQTNSDSVFLEVRESNTAARVLYEKLGFEQSGRRKSYYANPLEDAVLYRKTLHTDPMSG